MSWTHDHCDNPHIAAINERRARGILTLHAACDPPCPRRTAAVAYLGTLAHPEVLA